MGIKYLDDIERDKDRQNRIERNQNIADDVHDIMNKVMRENTGNSRSKESSFFMKLLKALFLVGLCIFVIDLLLGSVWLLKFLVKDLIFNYF